MVLYSVNFYENTFPNYTGSTGSCWFYQAQFLLVLRVQKGVSPIKTGLLKATKSNTIGFSKSAGNSTTINYQPQQLPEISSHDQYNSFVMALVVPDGGGFQWHVVFSKKIVLHTWTCGMKKGADSEKGWDVGL